MQPLISRGAVAAFMARPMDSFLWLKREHKEALLRELRQLPVRPVFTTEPWLHQLVCFYIGVCCPEFLFLLDMGLGKSKITLDVFTQRLRMREAHRCLVFVPRKVNHESWENAILDHSDLSYQCIDQSDIAAKWELLANPKHEVTTIDYQGFALACCVKVKSGKKNVLRPDYDKLDKLRKLYDFAVLDEIHKVARNESTWFELLRYLLDGMPYKYGATGTLFSKNVQALWTPYRLIDGGLTFGENRALFDGAFFEVDNNGFGGKLKFNRSLVTPLNKMLGNRSIRYADREVMDLPPLFIKDPVRFHMPEDMRTHYLRCIEGILNAGGHLAETKAQWFRMRQITAGYLAWEDGYGKHAVDCKEQPKLDYTEAMVDRLQGDKLLVSCEYTETGARIMKRLEQAKVKCVWLYGGSKDPSAVKRQFCEDPATQVMVMNSEAGGTGVDGLQKVCNHLLFYESPTHPTPRWQVIKRLSRPGQTKRVYVTDLVISNSVDCGILDDVKAGRDFFERVMNGTAPRGSFFG